MHDRKTYLVNWFSNFDKVYTPIVDDFDISYYTLENAFQAAKTLNRKRREEIAILSAGDSKKAGRGVTLRPDWEDVKLSIMKDFVRQKYEKNLDHQFELKRSGNHEIVEWNRWHDNFWGICLCPKCKNTEGKNHLGRIIQEVRADLIGTTTIKLKLNPNGYYEISQKEKK